MSLNVHISNLKVEYKIIVQNELPIEELNALGQEGWIVCGSVMHYWLLHRFITKNPQSDENMSKHHEIPVTDLSHKLL